MSGESVDYAFTITLGKSMYKLEPSVQYDYVVEDIVTRLSSISSKVTLVAELTKASNIHFHGIIKFKDSLKPFRLQFNNLFRNHKYIGYVHLVQITEWSAWTEYIQKELIETKDSLNRPPILLDGHDVFLEYRRDITKSNFLMNHDWIDV